MCFKQQRASCLVNPQACYETELVLHQAKVAKKLAVIGAGPAGLAFSVYAAQKGHQVTLFDKQNEIGGQFNVAKQIPGKEEFYETLRYFDVQLKQHGVAVELNSQQSVESLQAKGFDEVILATGITPRKLSIEGIEHKKVKTYLQVVKEKIEVGKRVAIIGAGGIGFDVGCYLVEQEGLAHNAPAWMKTWGVDSGYQRGGALLVDKQTKQPEREIYLLQRKTSKVGAGLGKTTGWIHRSTLNHNGVKMYAGVSYEKIDDKGLHITYEGESKVLEVDDVIICAGQEPDRSLYDGLMSAGIQTHLIGGADVAAELDAKRAIRQALELAITI